QAHVAWSLEQGHFDNGLKGHLDPPFLEGPLQVHTRGFEIFDRPAADPQRVHMMGVKDAMVRCNFVINALARSAYKFPGIVISNATVDTPTSRSHLDTTVTLGFERGIDIDLREGSHIDLAEISPLGTIPLSGALAIRATGRGPFNHPKIAADLKIT